MQINVWQPQLSEVCFLIRIASATSTDPLGSQSACPEGLFESCLGHRAPEPQAGEEFDPWDFVLTTQGPSPPNPKLSESVLVGGVEEEWETILTPLVT